MSDISTTVPTEPLQLNAQNKLRHLLSVDNLPVGLLHVLLERAQAFAQGATAQTNCNGLLANFFFEPSTRTRISFEIAARRLGWGALLLSQTDSSLQKGESISDTVATLAALGVDVICMRHSDPELVHLAAQSAPGDISIVNGGGGSRDHPTQGLLDALTIVQENFDWGNLSVAIVGDIRHSRVARSDIGAFTALGARSIRLAGPAGLLPDQAPRHCELAHDLAAGIADADVIIALRIQKERLGDSRALDLAAYQRDWCITEDKLKLAKPRCIVMHPGPVNRGVEIDDSVADGPRSRILKQVENGVYLRMAVLEALTSHH